LAISTLVVISEESRKIWDEKAEWISPAAWDGIPVQGMIRSMIQNLRIVYSDSCNNTYEMNLGYIGIRTRKVSETQWQLEAF
jgi:hypothetical protein